MRLLVYSRREHARIATGSVAAIATMTIHEMLSGSSKFEVTPGGGGKAGWMSSSSIATLATALGEAAASFARRGTFTASRRAPAHTWAQPIGFISRALFFFFLFPPDGRETVRRFPL